MSNSESKFKESRVSSKLVYEGFLKIFVDNVKLPDGNSATREYIVHPGASMVIPILENGNVIMERQYRYSTDQEYLEFPAGKIDRGESPLQTAIRELEEETGYHAEEMKHLTTIHPVIGYSNEIIEIYIAKKLKLREAKLDAGEFLEVVEINPQDLINWVRQSKVKDVKTQIGAFWLDAILHRGW